MGAPISWLQSHITQFAYFCKVHSWCRTFHPYTSPAHAPGNRPSAVPNPPWPKMLSQQCAFSSIPHPLLSSLRFTAHMVVHSTPQSSSSTSSSSSAALEAAKLARQRAAADGAPPESNVQQQNIVLKRYLAEAHSLNTHG